MPKTCWIHYFNGAERGYAFDRMEVEDSQLRLFRSAELVAEVRYEEIAGWVLGPDGTRRRARPKGLPAAH